MGIVVVPVYGSDPATITATNLDAKVAGLATEFNGQIDDANIKALAGIQNSKLNLTNIAQDVTLAGTNTLSGATTISGALSLSGTVSLGSKIFKLAKGADVASVAGAITLGDDGNYFDITGTNAITSITAKTAGTQVVLQFDSTASLVDGSNLKLAGDFQGAAESQIMLVSDGTNWFEVCRQPNTFTPTTSNALTGSIVQVVTGGTNSYISGSTDMPTDDTIPQNTEGVELFTATITPSNASNIILVFVNCVTSSNSTTQTIALFRDSTASAIAANFHTGGVSNMARHLNLIHSVTAGTTSATTFKVRGGGISSDTFRLNSQFASTSRVFGGVANSHIILMEVKA